MTEMKAMLPRESFDYSNLQLVAIFGKLSSAFSSIQNYQLNVDLCFADYNMAVLLHIEVVFVFRILLCHLKRAIQFVLPSNL